MAYTVMISEAQRVVLIEKMREAGVGKADWERDSMDSAPVLLELLENLPVWERESPGGVHGLCL